MRNRSSSNALRMRVERREIAINPWWTLSVLCLSLVMVVLGNTVLNVALPTLVRDLGATSTQLQWMVDSYALVFAGLLLTAGGIAGIDRRLLGRSTGHYAGRHGSRCSSRHAGDVVDPRVGVPPGAESARD